MKKLYSITSLTLVVLALLAFIFSPTSLAEDKTSNSILTIAQTSAMSTWDPHDDIPTHVANIKHKVYGTLTERNTDEELIGDLATDWEPINETTWRFHLREGVKFHNGEPFEAEDVKFSLERIVKNESLHAHSFTATIESVEIVDSHTVDIHTYQPDAALPARLCFCQFIVPADTVKDVGWEEFLKNPVGTGPFEFVEWERDQKVVLKRNENYWGDNAKIEKLVFKPIVELSTRLSALKTEEVDIARSIPADQVSWVESQKGLTVKGVRSGRNNFIILTEDKEPFGNRLVRQAMNYAVDVDSMIDYLFGGKAYRTPTICGPVWFGCDMGIEPYPYDPAKARNLLNEAGFPEGFETTLAVAQGRPAFSERIAESIKFYLGKIGVDVDIKVFEWGEYLDVWLKGEYPMLYMGFGIPTLDLDSIFGNYFDPNRRSNWGTIPEEAIELGRKALKTAERSKRKKYYSQMQKIIKEDAPFIFLFNFEDNYGIRENIKGFHPPADEIMKLTDVYLEK